MLVTLRTVALYCDRFDTDPLSVDLDWRKELVPLFTVEHEESPCTVDEGPYKCRGKGCPYKSRSPIPNKAMGWSPVVIEGKRLGANVRLVTLLNLDLDRYTYAEAKDAEERLRPYEHLWHTTHSHRNQDGEIALRVITPPSRIVTAEEYPEFLAGAIAFLGVRADPSCKDLARMHYRPSHPTGAPFASEHVEGKLLDVDEVLAWYRTRTKTAVLPPAPVREATPLPAGESWDLESEAVRAAVTLVAENFPDLRRHELCLALGGMLRRAGATEEDAYQLVHEMARLGGSDNPNARAATVAHTYTLPDDAGMTGFTRVGEILGEDVADELGELLGEARNEALLRPLEERRKAALSGSGATPGPVPPLPYERAGAEVPAPPPLPTASMPVLHDLAPLRKRVSALATRKAKSTEQNDRVSAVLLRRVLHGEALAHEDPAGDSETVRAGSEVGVSRRFSLRSVVGTLAFALPAGTPWEAVAEILEPSVKATDPTRHARWMAVAKRAYLRAQQARAEAEAKAEAEEAARKETERARMLAPPLPQQLHHQSRLKEHENDVRQVTAVPPLPYEVPQQGAPGESKEKGTSNAPEAPPPVALIHRPPLIVPATQVPRLPRDPREWFAKCRKTADGAPASAPHTARMVFEHHPDIADTLFWNEVTKEVEVRGGILASAAARGFEHLVVVATDYLYSAHGVSLSHTDVGRRLVAVARMNSYDPIKDYLNSLVWDGQPRAARWLAHYCGAEDNATTRLMGMRWIISFVARGLFPGCKVDNVLVMEGPGGLGKCLQRGTSILMFDGTIKPVEMVRVGDLLMGPDSRPRRVRSTTTGRGALRRIVPIKGDPWVCNDAHILTVGSHQHDGMIDVPVSECYSKGGQTYRRGDYAMASAASRYRGATITARIKGQAVEEVRQKYAAGCTMQEIADELGVSCGTVRNALRRPLDAEVKHQASFQKHANLVQVRCGVEFPEQEVPFDPYWTGLWLGDGTVGKAQITTMDDEISDYCQRVAKEHGVMFNIASPKEKDHVWTFTFTTMTLKGQKYEGRNPVLTYVKTLMVDGEKRVPRAFLINCRKVRLAVLAGLIDTDGYLGQGVYEICTRYSGLRDDILFLARSLGFAAYVKEKRVAAYPGRVYHRITISGDLSVVPCLLPRKKALPRQQKKDVLRTGFTIEDAGEGEYFGFELDGDGRFLLGDFTVTHNSSAFEILGGPWFCDTAIVLGDKDSRMLAVRYWLSELAEIAALLKRSGYDTFKGFISTKVDRFRPPYAAAIEEFLRRCVFVGTTNDEEYLTDPTGNRKVWCVRVTYAPEGLDALRHDRDQLLAEAVAMLRAGERWWFGYEEISITEAEADKRVVETPAAIRVREWWYDLAPKNRPASVTTVDVAEQALGVTVAQLSASSSTSTMHQVGHALRKMGFVKRRDTAGERDYRWYASRRLLDAPRVQRGSLARPLVALAPPAVVEHDEDPGPAEPPGWLKSSEKK